MTHDIVEAWMQSNRLASEFAWRMGLLFSASVNSAARRELDAWVACLQGQNELALRLAKAPEGEHLLAQQLQAQAVCAEQALLDLRNHIQTLVLMQEEAMVRLREIGAVLANTGNSPMRSDTAEPAPTSH